jgi:hypothetical protein
MLAMGILSSRVVGQVTLGHVDNFQSLDTSGWTMGLNSIMLPTVISTGGPMGANDASLEVISTGGSKANSKMITFNACQWTGNYVAAGVTSITTEMADFGLNPLFMRIAIQDNFGSEYGSTTAVMLPADSRWHPLSFDMMPSGLTLIQGGSSATQSLSNVGVLRVLSAQNAPSFMGDTVKATLGIDDITAVPEPGLLAPLALLGFFRRPPPLSLQFCNLCKIICI